VLSTSPRLVLASFAAGLVLAVAGCGGGGGGGSNPTPTPADVVDKYIGSWLSSCDVTGPDTSETELLTLKKKTATSVSFTDTNTNYATNNCSGAGTAQPAETGTATWNGTKTTTAGQTVDKIDIAIDGMAGTQKQIVMIGSDGKFYTGDENGTVDASGYPNTLQATGSTKQP
jgi:hypothetical protein